MNEQQVDEILAKCQKYRGITEIFGLLICLFTASFIMWLAFISGWFLLVLALPLVWIGCELWAQLKAALNGKNAWSLWDEFMTRYYGAMHVSEASGVGVQRLSKRIRALYEADGTDRILPVRMAARLLDTYNKQLHLTTQIKKRMQQNESLYQKLSENVTRLAELESVHESGQNSLRELAEDKDKLQRVQAGIETSMRHLEGVLERAEIEAQKRVLHAEVTRLTQTANSTTAAEKPEIYIGEVVSDLEQQISSEVAHYLKLEQEIEMKLH